jgi:hypothetical protein
MDVDIHLKFVVGHSLSMTEDLEDGAIGTNIR